MIYLDNAATTFPKGERVYQEMDYIARNQAVNAGRGSYAQARQATRIIETTRNKLLNLMNANQVAEAVFTASATIACNQILGGFYWKAEDVVYVSPYEHNAIMRTLAYFQTLYHFKIVEMPLTKEFEIDLLKLRNQFAYTPPTHICCTFISNVTGYILPIKQIIDIGKEYQAVTIVDAAQAVGLIPIDVKALDLDYLIFAGHKSLYGPLGVGGFIMKKNLKLKPYLVGGTGSDSLNLHMPEDASARYEPGSPNVVAIGGLLAAIEELEASQDTSKGEAKQKEQGYFSYCLHEHELTLYLKDKLKQIPSCTLYVPRKEENHIGIVSFNLEGYQAGELGQILDEDYGIAVRSGYHCAPKIHEHLKNYEYHGCVRASVGRYTLKEDLDQFVQVIEELSKEV